MSDENYLIARPLDWDKRVVQYRKLVEEVYALGEISAEGKSQLKDLWHKLNDDGMFVRESADEIEAIVKLSLEKPIKSKKGTFEPSSEIKKRSLQTHKERSLNFSGFEWEVKNSPGLKGPGPNYWNRGNNNVWVDSAGSLHLKITDELMTPDGGEDRWYCASVRTLKRLGFGLYEFLVIGRLDWFDPNVVLGLFNYPPKDVGVDGTHEIDIEIARWGNADSPNGNFVVWPSQAGLKKVSRKFDFSLNGTHSLHRFYWTSQFIRFASFHGHVPVEENKIEEWVYHPNRVERHIPQQPFPLHMNLWLFKGKPPINTKEAEVVIKRFRFTPQTFVE